MTTKMSVTNIRALKALTVEDVPEFKITVTPSTFECA